MHLFCEERGGRKLCFAGCEQSNLCFYSMRNGEVEKFSFFGFHYYSWGNPGMGEMGRLAIRNFWLFAITHRVFYGELRVAWRSGKAGNSFFWLFRLLYALPK